MSSSSSSSLGAPNSSTRASTNLRMKKKKEREHCTKTTAEHRKMAAQNDPLGSTGIPSFSIEQSSTRRVGCCCCCCLVALIQHRTPTTQRQVERMACTQGDNTREKKQPEKEVQASKTSLEASFSVGDQRRRRRRSVAPD